jgi:hypothetical protein
MKKFTLKLLLFLSPIIFVLITYIYFDPFKVLYKYDCYYDPNNVSCVTLNRDFVSTENWIRYYDTYKYDSYILGNSRSLYYKVEDWTKHITSNKNQCYHFDAANESLYGITKKFEFLESRNVAIKNAIIIFDYQTLKQIKNTKMHIGIKHPFLSGENSMAFQLEYFKTYLDFKFLYAFLDYKYSGKVKTYMKKNYLLDDTPVNYDPITNEVSQDYYENIIKMNPGKFYGERKGIFYKRDTLELVNGKVIKDEQLEMLVMIKKILNKNHTNYKIIINPLYDQKKFNHVDLNELKKIFGVDNVFDFSGINEFTKDKYNYYESSHYRPHLASKIMEIIYRDNRK